MKLIACRVQNYRSITDSGWVDIDDIAVIVGKNESGKTSFLKALWKFNPFNPEPTTLIVNGQGEGEGRNHQTN